MGCRNLRTRALGAVLLGTTGLTAPALAQTGEPAHRALDANGVDLISGTYPFVLTEGTIGSGPGAITIERHGTDPGGVGNWQNMWAHQSISGGTTTVVVVLGDRSETFTSTGSGFTPAQANGATLSGGGGSAFVYTAPDGRAITFGAPADDQYGASNLCAHTNANQSSCCATALGMAQPDGMTVTFGWTVHANCSSTFNSDGSLDCTYAWRLDTVENSFGYSVDFAYVTDFASLHQNPSPDWYKRSGETLSNGTTTRTVSNTFVSSTVTDMTDADGRVWRVTNGTNSLGIRRPGSSSDDITVSFSGFAVTQIVRDGITTNYSRSVSGNNATTTITDAASQVTTIVADTAIGQITSVTDPLSHTTSYTYDGNGRLTRITQPEGNYTNYTRDSRGNVTEVRQVAKPSTGLPDVVTSATYISSCIDSSCNSPLTTTDERGNVTDYAYDGTHGGVLTVTGPAPGGTGTRPQTRYSYTPADGGYLLTGISACATGSTASPTCVDTADEIRTVICYDDQGNATSVTRRDGAGTLIATSTMTYDDFGNLLTVDGPISGTADTTRYRYNSARQVIGEIGPDPDGGGALHHRAIRVTYGADGQATKVERGTVDSQSDADWALFSPLQEMQAEYDAHHRLVVHRLVSGSTTYSLTQTSYDSLGRANCVAQRMNPSEFATSSLPSDACTLDTTGSYGPDRIVRTSFDNAGRPNLVQTGYGVSGVQADEVATTYTANGQIERVTDAEANRTTYAYDGLDRLTRTSMPSPTTDNTSSTSDYEELTYVTAASGTRSTSLVASRRLRDNSSVAYSYDALGRLTATNVPNTAYAEYDSTYDPDLPGRLTASSHVGAHSVSFTYDALGRRVGETSYFGTKTMQYDLAGRLTRLTWPDSFQVGYYYNETDLTEIRESPSGANLTLASYTYDDLGRRTSLTRGNNAVTNYTYDAVGRTTQIFHDLASTASDLTLDLGFNPAGQIASTTRSNDSYAWGGHYAFNRSYITDGLNQYSHSGPADLSYDGRGNLSQSSVTGLPTLNFTYTSQNRLSAGPSSSLIVYDPFGRFLQVYHADSGGGHYQRFDSLGGTLISELDTSNVITRRYVPGPGMDEPVVWYEGSGTSTRRYYHADERGSIVAVSDAGGNAYAINSYDEHGIPGASNSGRFQYTGQLWMPELGMYHYRARLYSPTLGRFMQTDPIGFGGGMNIYGYARNDAINLTDPLGLDPPAPSPTADDDDTITVNGRRRPKRTNGCEPGEVRLGGYCISGFDLRNITLTDTTMTLISLTNPNQLIPGCSANGSVITCQVREPDSPPTNYCDSASYKIGRMLDDLGRFGQRAAILAAVVGFTMDGPGSAMPALAAYSIAGDVRMVGTLLEWYGGAPFPAYDMGTTIASRGLGADLVLQTIADIAGGAVGSVTLRPDSCP